MEKIPTIFDRNWETNRKINDKLAVTDFDFKNAIATEKLDGTNVRITVRNHTVVRVEKRRNPDKKQKANGIKDP
ncbi:RNA ligase family protein [Bernardetia litoralis]|uniref:RNA ligase family protein n=1 Tax=Bernardetia litoralis TaxID=999 RepID=UPI0002D3EBC5|nr:RNA ligase family protein [Bernardetia litoralis]